MLNLKRKYNKIHQHIAIVHLYIHILINKNFHQYFYKTFRALPEMFVRGGLGGWKALLIKFEGWWLFLKNRPEEEQDIII